VEDPTDCVSDEVCALGEGLTENPAAYAAYCLEGISTDGDFGILNWPSSAVRAGPPSRRTGTLIRA
jgi:hypothetical protein